MGKRKNKGDLLILLNREGTSFWAWGVNNRPTRYLSFCPLWGVALCREGAIADALAAKKTIEDLLRRDVKVRFTRGSLFFGRSGVEIYTDGDRSDELEAMASALGIYVENGRKGRRWTRKR